MTERAEALDLRAPGVYRCRVHLDCAGCKATLTGYAAEGASPEEAMAEALSLTRAEARGAGWTLATYAHGDRCPTCARKKP